MSKKPIILFIFTFILSTTGLSLSLHYCQIQESTSLSSCEMCAVEETEANESCCEKQENYPVQIKNDLSDGCCITKVINTSIKDNFWVNKSEVKIDFKIIAVTLSAFNLTYSDDNAHSLFRSGDSSPPLIKNELCLFNSILLI